jgi:hypothetical protein
MLIGHRMGFAKSSTNPAQLRAASPGAQARSHATAATKQHDGQISKSLSSPLAKNISLNLSGKSLV